MPPPLIKPALERAIRAMPKAALHVHLEGALRWSTVRMQYQSSGDLPARPPWLSRKDPFPRFADFLKVFQNTLRPSTGSPEAIETHARHVVEDLADLGVVYAELIVSATFHQNLGLDVMSVLRALARGAACAAQDRDIDVRLVLGINRHRPIDQVEQELDTVLEQGDPGLAVPLCGIDLQGDERQKTPADYRALYVRAAQQGLRLRAHAGELCGAHSVGDAVHVLGASHVSHGVRVVEDPVLLRQLAEAGVWFHVCPTSNLRLHVVRGYEDHPLRRMLESGCRVTIDADDPLLFGTDITEEHLRLASAFSLPAIRIEGIARWGIEASLLSEVDKQRHLAKIRDLFAPLH